VRVSIAKNRSTAQQNLLEEGNGAVDPPGVVLLDRSLVTDGQIGDGLLLVGSP